MLDLEVLIRELLAVDGLATGAVAIGEVTTLDHELLDNAVEGRALVAVALLAGSQSAVWSAWSSHRVSDSLVPEVLSGLHRVSFSPYIIAGYTHLGNSLAVEAHHNATEVLITLLDVEIDLPTNVSPWTLGCKLPSVPCG